MAGLLQYLGQDPEVIRKQELQAARKGLGKPLNTIHKKPQKTIGGPQRGVTKGMKEVKGYRVPNAALEGPKSAPKAAKGGSGLLGKLGKVAKVAGPVGTAISVLDPTYMGDATRPREPNEYSDNTPIPEQQSTADWVNQLTGGMMDDIRGQMPPPAPPQSPVQEAPQAPPEVVEQQRAQQDAQVEQKRQVLQQGAQKGLATGEVSRPQLAESVVKADAERAGTELNPEETKAAVQEELSAMKTMDNEQLSKYASYALIAGGVLASFMDDSGQAGDIFHDSYNQALDRGQAEAARAQAAVAAERKEAREDRKVDLTELDTHSKVDDRLVGQKMGERRYMLDETLGLGSLDNQKQRTGIMGAQLSETRSQNQARNAYNDARLKQFDAGLFNAAEKNRITEANSGGRAGGITLSQKDAMEVVNSSAKSAGFNISGDVKRVLAADVSSIMKNTDATAQEAFELAYSRLESSEEKPGWLSRDPTIRFK